MKWSFVENTTLDVLLRFFYSLKTIKDITFVSFAMYMGTF